MSVLVVDLRTARRVRVFGRVQGVGFRPFVVRLARELGLTGDVSNDASGVSLHVEGPAGAVDAFARRLRDDAPTEARVERIESACAEPRGDAVFAIAEACDISEGPVRARVPSDRATCPACFADAASADPRRGGYPFVACAACGPRFTLIRDIPYARAATSLAEFPFCPACADEFADPDDPRFHAETTACSACGPALTFIAGEQRVMGREAVTRAAAALASGAIVALKALGGYQLLARADAEASIALLRERKRRPRKPLALLVADVTAAEQTAWLTARERELLTSPENPIVLARRRDPSTLAPNVAPGAARVGLMLPTTPLHRMLAEASPVPLVATSANRSDEPLLLEDGPALRALADAVLTHDRAIVRRADDSVVHVVADRPTPVRLARGHAPLSLDALERWAARRDLPPTLATGGHLKAAMALWTGTQAVLGPHVGDLDGPAARAAWRTQVADLERLYRTRIAQVAHDLHPEYATTRWAQASGLPTTAVQHHHAHAVAAMIDHDLLERPVLALAWDGVGYGPDGTAWGGEILRATMATCVRVGRLRPFALPGGDVAAREPWRVAASLAHATFGDVGVAPFDRAVSLGPMLRAGDACPTTTSLGRLFDGIAGWLLGIASIGYEGEAAMALEAIAEPGEPYRLDVVDGEWDWRPTMRDLVADRESGASIARCAGRFHETVAAWAAQVVATQPESHVVLGGGCMQNALLVERVRARLSAIGKRVWTPGTIPAGDGGLAAGQLGVALARMARG